MQESTATKNSEVGSPVIPSGRNDGIETACTKIGTQENLTFCAHRGHGCISQNGYVCTHGPKCEPIDSNGRRFVVFEWIENGQRLATRHYLPEPVICADTQQAAREAEIRGAA